MTDNSNNPAKNPKSGRGGKRLRYTGKVFIPQNRGLSQETQQEPSPLDQLAPSDPTLSLHKTSPNGEQQGGRWRRVSTQQEETDEKETPVGEESSTTSLSSPTEETTVPHAYSRGRNRASRRGHDLQGRTAASRAGRNPRSDREDNYRHSSVASGPPRQPQQHRSSRPRPPQSRWRATRISSAHSELTDLAEELMTALANDSYECMICMSIVKRRQSIWHCEECYALFHFECIAKWSKNSLDEARQQPPSFLPQKPPPEGWRCPHCNKGHHEREGPPVPLCFCGKVRHPEFNPYITPHSCGDLCGRIRSGDCPHPCNLCVSPSSFSSARRNGTTTLTNSLWNFACCRPCHPGPCPPCSATSPVKYCWCGNEEYRTRCGEADPGRSCGEVCDRPLACHNHRCEDACHPGPCQKCAKLLPMKCYCGKAAENRACGTQVEDSTMGEVRHFSCGGVCGRQLACGNHTCQRTCHTGPCNECAVLPKNVDKCACGKTDILSIAPPRKSCLDPIATCSKKCEKKLHCGVHMCTQPCHLGECPPCKGGVEMPCRCKLNTKKISCLQAFPLKESSPSGDSSTSGAVVTCDVACNVARSCGRHRCNIKCCPSAGNPLADEHICKIPCKKPLKCGTHQCGVRSHPLPSRTPTNLRNKCNTAPLP